MAHAPQRRGQRFQRRAALELGFLVAAAQVGQRDRLLHVQLPIEHADQRLGHVVDDGAAAGRTQRQHGLAGAKHDHGRHRAARPLARLDPVGDQPPFRIAVGGREVRHLVVEQETAHEDLAAERGLDGGRHGNHVARGIHRHQVAGRGHLDGVVARAFGQQPLRIARQGRLHAAVGADQRAALAQVGGIEQRPHRNIDKGRIGHVEVSVGEGQPPGLGKIMHGLDTAGTHARQRVLFQFAQHLQHRQRAAARRRRAAQAVAPVQATHRLAHHGPVAGQVGLGQVARRGMGTHRRHDVARDRPAVEGIGPLARDAAQRGRELGIPQPVADRPGLPVGAVEVARRRGLRRQRLVAGDGLVQARRHGEPLLGHRDGRLEQGLPWQLAVLAMRQLQAAQQARRADRAAVVDRFGIRQRLALAQEAVGPRSRGRGLAAVVDAQLAGAAVVVHHEGAAAYARGLRLDQVQHQLRGDDGVGGAAAGPQDTVAGLAGQRVGGGDHVALGVRLRALAARAGDLRIDVLARHARRLARPGRRLANGGGAQRRQQRPQWHGLPSSGWSNGT
ncbi:Uncharacterised protein [Bordetella pertussis]|nr:Uncharacterised protein [Bordetella pertussis]CPP94298.1 Uncharacterised protein [Bordetella pertussis]